MELVLGDITKISAAVLVNAANTKLQHGGGVAAVIAHSQQDYDSLKNLFEQK